MLLAIREARFRASGPAGANRTRVPGSPPPYPGRRIAGRERLRGGDVNLVAAWFRRGRFLAEPSLRPLGDLADQGVVDFGCPLFSRILGPRHTKAERLRDRRCRYVHHAGGSRLREKPQGPLHGRVEFFAGHGIIVFVGHGACPPSARARTIARCRRCPAANGRSCVCRAIPGDGNQARPRLAPSARSPKLAPEARRNAMPSLSAEAVRQYAEQGFYAPIGALSEAEAAAVRRRLEEYESHHGVLQG